MSSLFGAGTAPAGAGGSSLFGAPTSTAGFGASAAPAFGTSTSSFGPGSSFGAAPAGNSAFGGTSSIFGGGAATAPATTGSLFGGGSGGGFGTGSASTFGATPAAGSAFGSGGNTGLFGNTSSTTSLFGAPSSGNAFAPTGGFGTGLGRLGAASGFGTGSSAGGLFGATPNTLYAPTGSAAGGFGAPATTGLYGNQPPIPKVDRQTEHVLASEAPGVPWWYRELAKIQAAYRVCQFSKLQTMMYEVSPTAPDIHGQTVQVSLAMMEQAKTERKRQLIAQVPWLENNMREWHLFEERNPDPANWLPCPVIGVDAICARVDAQAKYTKEQLQSVEKEKNKDWLAAAAADIRLLDQKIESCRRAHANVTNRMVGILGRLEKLQARQGALKGPRAAGEIRYHERLEKLRKLLDDPKGCKAKLLQIEARLGELLNRKTDFMEDPGQSTSEIIPQPVKDQEEDEKKMQQLLTFMEEQRQSISAVIETIRRDSRDIKMMREKLAAQ